MTINSKKKLIKDISANTLQTVITQFFGLLIFYILSRYLLKSDFGEYNWSIALGFTIISIVSLGLDLVLVKRIASGKSTLEVGGIHFFHTVSSGIILTVIILFLQFCIPAFSIRHPLFFLMFINILIINMTNTFKLCLNGMDSYSSLAILSLCSNLIKFLLILFLYFQFGLNLLHVTLVLLISSVIEFLLGYLLLNRLLSDIFKPVLRMNEYKKFILESLPQLGVVIFDSALSRMDIILLGILSTATITAEYSFVYKVYELSKLPLLIIGPVLLTRFSKLFSQNNTINQKQQEEIHFFFKLELFLIMLIPVFLVATWSPLVDYFTGDKYGHVNETKFWLLSICVPLVCVVNFLWTLGFVQGQLKEVMYITLVVSVMNIISNLILIPFFGGDGSTIAFLFSTIVQVLLYLKFINQTKIKLRRLDWLISIINASVALIAAKFILNNIIFTTITALVIYFILSILTKQVDIKKVREILVVKSHL